MFVAFTNHDEVTDVLSLCAKRFLVHCNPEFLASPPHENGHDSIGSTCESLLALSLGMPFVFFGHGAKPPAVGLIGQAGFHDVFPNGNFSSLNNRLIIAICCHSTGALARELDATVVGFREAILVPCGKPYSSMFVDCMDRGLKQFSSNVTANEIASDLQTALAALACDLFDGSEHEGWLVAINIEMDSKRVSLVGDGALRPFPNGD